MNGQKSVSVEEDIFKEFFRRLGTVKLPSEVINTLKKLWESDRLESKENILKALEEGIENANKHQKH